MAVPISSLLPEHKSQGLFMSCRSSVMAPANKGRRGQSWGFLVFFVLPVLLLSILILQASLYQH